MIESYNNSKILVISHIADIDGMGSVILANKFYGVVDYILCDIGNLVDALKRIENKEYDIIYICDLSFVSDAVSYINDHSYLIEKIKHFDHHSSRIDDTTPSYANYVLELNGRKTSATELFYNYLISLNNEFKSKFYDEFVEGIRANDTWDMNGDFELGRKLASIHAILGSNPFIEMVLSLDANQGFVLPKVYLDFIKADQDKMDSYIKNANKNLCISEYNGMKIGVSITEQYRSVLGDEICKLNPEIAFILIINFNRMSCSLRTTRDDIHLGEICKEFHHDGGGHRKAAGFIIDSESIPKIKKYIDDYLE